MHWFNHMRLNMLNNIRSFMTNEMFKKNEFAYVETYAMLLKYSLTIIFGSHVHVDY